MNDQNIYRILPVGETIRRGDQYRLERDGERGPEGSWVDALSISLSVIDSCAGRYRRRVEEATHEAPSGWELNPHWVAAPRYEFINGVYVRIMDAGDRDGPVPQQVVNHAVQFTQLPPATETLANWRSNLPELVRRCSLSDPLDEGAVYPPGIDGAVGVVGGTVNKLCEGITIAIVALGKSERQRADDHALALSLEKGYKETIARLTAELKERDSVRLVALEVLSRAVDVYLDLDEDILFVHRILATGRADGTRLEDIT